MYLRVMAGDHTYISNINIVIVDWKFFSFYLSLLLLNSNFVCRCRVEGFQLKPRWVGPSRKLGPEISRRARGVWTWCCGRVWEKLALFCSFLLNKSHEQSSSAPTGGQIKSKRRSGSVPVRLFVGFVSTERNDQSYNQRDYRNWHFCNIFLYFHVIVPCLTSKDEKFRSVSHKYA